MQHQTTAPLVSASNWIRQLTQRVYSDLPSDLRLAHIQLQQATPLCSLDDSNLCSQDKSPLHISCALAPARICSARKTIEAHQIVGTIKLGSEHIQLIQQPMFVGIGVLPNVRLTTIMCKCGEHHCQVKAVRPIGEHEILCSGTEEREETLLVQFDGSCHADRGV